MQVDFIARAGRPPKIAGRRGSPIKNRNQIMSKDNLTERLSRLDTCAVSDALDRLGMPGVVLGLRPMTVIRRVAGRVITSELGPVDGRVSTRHLGTAAIDAATPGDVIVMAHKGRLDAA